MHSPACSIHVPMAKRGQPVVLTDIASPRLPTGPRLDWVTRAKGADVAAMIDVRGVSAWRRAGLYAYARPSPNVGLFVFTPDLDGPGWRYESWLLTRTDMPDEPGKDRLLHKPIIGDRRMRARGDLVQALIECERETADEMKGWLGGLL